MDRLREKIQGLKGHFEYSLSEMLETEENSVHNIHFRITRLHHKLQELSGEVERVIRESFK